VKFTLNILKRHRDEERGWPDYLFGGHVRTSTLVLIVALVAVAWVYNTATYRPPAQVVPPGFVPDPNYTWVQRSRVDQPPSTVTVTLTPTTTTTPPSPTTTTTTTTPPPFQLPCIPPFCTPSPTTSPSQLPQPGPGPAPTASPPAR
jgi:hypothetical protein